MSIRLAKINLNADGTWTVRVGRMVEHIDPNGKTPGELFDAVKFALMSKGVPLEDVDLIELMQEEKFH